ncbi:hypothetical protein CYMTET_18431, partial [Cymbomonas tetramitiformis]
MTELMSSVPSVLKCVLAAVALAWIQPVISASAVVNISADVGITSILKTGSPEETCVALAYTKDEFESATLTQTSSPADTSIGPFTWSTLDEMTSEIICGFSDGSYEFELVVYLNGPHELLHKSVSLTVHSHITR